MEQTNRAGYRAIYYNDLLAFKALFYCFDAQDRVRQFVVKSDAIVWSGI